MSLADAARDWEGDSVWRSPAEFADYLGISERQLWRWLQANEPALEVIRIGKVVRVRLARFGTQSHPQSGDTNGGQVHT